MKEPGQILSGSLSNEPMRVETIRQVGKDTWVPGPVRPAGTIGLTPNKKRVVEDRRDCYWLYVVTDCSVGQASSLSFEAGRMPAPHLQIIKDPASLPWHEVKKVDHYWVSVDAMRQPMRVREEPPPPDGGAT